MCCNKIRIERPRSVNAVSADGEFFTSPLRKRVYYIPCGKCPECQQRKRDGYYLRSHYQFLKAGERGIFTTLTYDNAHLPIYTYETEPIFSPSGEILEYPRKRRVSTWDKKHIQLFFKQLNEKIIYFYGTKILGLKRLKTDGRRKKTIAWKDFEVSLRKNPLFSYFLVCERGKADIYTSDKGRKRRGTARPHYHVIFYLNNPDIPQDMFLEFIKELWEYGHVYNLKITDVKDKDGKSLGRTDSQCLAYVTKYVTKDINDKTNFIPFRNHSDLLRYTPFVTSSHYFGLSILETLSDDALVNALVNGVTISYPGGKPRTFQLPPYYNNYVGTLHNSVTQSVVDVFDTPHMEGSTFVQIDEPVKMKKRFTKSFLSPFGQYICELRNNRTADYYRDIYINFVNLSHPAVIPFRHVDADSLARFVEHLNMYADDLQRYDDVAQLYKVIDQLISEEKHQRQMRHELNYKRNLEKAIQKTPNRFNLNPL